MATAKKREAEEKPLDQRLKGYIVSTVIEWMRQQKKVYRDLTEDQQRNLIDQLDTATARLLVEAVDEIATKGFRAVRGTLEGLTIKSDVKAAVKLLNSDDTIKTLATRANQSVLIVCADPNEFFGGDLPKPQRDQADIEGDRET